ncbi:hypothetical protein [Actinomycetospora termitidis]|uniref:Uncharacterized protein n=1 Tax=Actinomycetospora termitidis TaxID=3053470 RepID=A0ABT7MDG0_9PSEU|nr:hypothetical protein [Actinomycetospora sp. Odt1-22]MDL5158708.1 hypothetical protein [Actinomycetospora sp. Odt1-22]
MTTGSQRTRTVLHLPCLGPDAVPLERAVAAVLGYARGRRWLRFRSPGRPEGRWVRVPAFGWARFDAHPPSTGPDADVLIAEGLHGRLDRTGWHAVHDALVGLAPVVEAVGARAAGRPFWELPADEFSVLDEPGTVGALLRHLGQEAGPHPAHVLAALHHRHPDLVPHLTPTTRRALLPHVEEGDSGVEAVVHRELRANAGAFAELEAAVAAVVGDARPGRLRLHDVLLWLTTTLRLAHAVELGEHVAG